MQRFCLFRFSTCQTEFQKVTKHSIKAVQTYVQSKRKKGVVDRRNRLSGVGSDDNRRFAHIKKGYIL